MAIHENLIKIISKQLHLKESDVEQTILLIDEGASIPFIARYRKEKTGSMEDVQIAAVSDLYEKLQTLEKRKQSIISTIEEQGVLTPELKKRIEDSYQSQELEDIYLPYKPKRKTRAENARQKGLEPLAAILMKQCDNNGIDRAKSFISKDVKTVDEALSGARDIIAEWINEHHIARDIIRKHFSQSAIIATRLIKGKEYEGIKYKDYFTYNTPLKKISSHALLAILRGEHENILRLNITPNEERLIDHLKSYFVKSNNECSEQVEISLLDAYKRLLKPSIEKEFVNAAKDKADDEAIQVFGSNLRQLLLSPPLGQKRVLAIDPGFRTGCKIVCLNAQGDLEHNETVYIHPPTGSIKTASKKISTLVEAYKIDAIAIGNGTAGRETEEFIKKLTFNRSLQIFSVSESGASIYSASSVAREEFPDYDITVRGSVSIGRRLMDPLAELVKIDPKSIGVGQYQHDVDQTKLKSRLHRVVESCVNSVGINVNSASKHILTHISGLSATLAQNIVNYRKDLGVFTSRDQLLQVPRMGAKAYEQCAGFLRISDAENPLDNTAVHPESYAIVNSMAKKLNCSLIDLVKDKSLQAKININDFVTEKVGLPSLKLIQQELQKPSRDPRNKIEVFEFDSKIKTINDLQVGMKLDGIVTNITRFGAFVDIGIKENGLVHISNMTDHFIRDPMSIVSIHEHVKVRILEINIAQKRIQLSMKDT